MPLKISRACTASSTRGLKVSLPVQAGWRGFPAIALCLLALAIPAAADSQPEPLIILAPSQARPIFCRPGKTFYFLVRLTAQLGEKPRIWLRHSIVPEIRYPLIPADELRRFADGYASAQMIVPTSTPPGLYDIVLSGPRKAVVSRRCVHVVSEFKTQFRFVHLSNMNIGDPTAPDFDPQIPFEVNLLAPEFIIATGDYTEWARQRNDPRPWGPVLDYFARFNAPVYMLCGDHDHEASFTKYVANSLIGTIDYGDYHGLLLLDHGARPIDRDEDQLNWILADLAENRKKTFNFLVAHSDELGLIRRLKQKKIAEQVIRDFRVKMLICGGHTDWDYKEFAPLLKDLPELHYIRTAQASTAVRDKATGVPHYRVIEISGNRIDYIYPADDVPARLQHSVPAGRLRAVFDAPNDGSQGRVTVTVSNALNRPWKGCRIWLRVRKSPGGRKPAVAGGKLLQCLDVGKYWACLVGFDLPDKGAVSICADWQGDLPPPVPVRLELRSPVHLTFTERQAPFGLTYYTSDAAVALRLTNASDKPRNTWPVVRLNGSTLQFGSASRLPIALPPRATVTLRVVPTLGKLSPGLHMLQVYLLEDPLRRLVTNPVIISPIAGEPPPATQPSRPGPRPASQPVGPTP